MISHTKSFRVRNMKLRPQDLESCGVTKSLLEQLQPLITPAPPSRVTRVELSFFHVKRREHANEERSR
ncbi:hypothetical protein [Sinorhizobium meliloti]|uniref:hypothetical protein n=1 Tax=Rhizobium meliloti TaxID=382 RepID=UPI000FDB3A15|nr:hypothetical protein [Sinorhizobium meliloti]MQX01396.1 hypothetical protein [Sinorhizobium meliloti]RVG05667.1 hypothetical protein CN234_24110 [Sinorhizobium meliloti]RVK44200.1 hypothetical protein CN160_27285 [Sinorhizobium meliloti]